MLVWEPGVGKTYPPLCAATFLNGPSLYVVPAHLRLQWLKAAAEFVPWQKAVVLDKLKEKAGPKMAGADIVIVSYEYMAELPRWKELRKREWASITFDECHYLTSLDANRTRAALGLRADERHGLVFATDRVWLLSGTPFTFPNEIFPILSRCFPAAIKRPRDEGGGYMTEREWENRFCVVAETDFGYKVTGARNVPELRDRLAPFLDKQKLDLPVSLNVDTIPIKGTLRGLLKGLPSDVLAAYEALTEILDDDDIPDADKMAALEDNGMMMAQLRHVIAVTKIKATAEIVRHELFTGVRKLLVFGWHRAPLKALADELAAPLIYGGIGDGKKERIKEDFIEGDAPVLIGQIGAIATGTDGLQHACHRSLVMEAPWTVRENKQLLNRTYRTGQKFACHTSYISLVGSVDEYVAKILKRNAEIVSAALD